LKNPELVSKNLYYQLADLFEISVIYNHNGKILFRARPYLDKDKALQIMRQRLKKAGFEASVSEDLHGLLIGVRETTAGKIPRLNVILFLATLLTMYVTPLFYFGWSGAESLRFTLALMSILLFHEFGHYLAGRQRGILMSLPYFIPAPNFVGTFGAIIHTRSPFTNRRDLILVGATGPIAGFVIAIVVLSLGLSNPEIAPTGAEVNLVVGNSLLINFLTWLMTDPVPEGYDIIISPIFFAGWVGLLVTMINLLPLGQLDGGHIAYGLLGAKQRNVSRLFIIVMLALGFLWKGWWLFGILVLLFGINHPPTLDDARPLSRTTLLLGLVALVIFIVCFIPVPFSLT
jgi:membrane-associated protease RseP (regulator of RpoE activity)